MLRLAAVFAVLLAVAAPAAAQTAVAVNVPLLTAFPGFYHGKDIVVRGELSRAVGWGMLKGAGSDRSVPVFGKTADADGAYDVRGQFWDLGRLNADDPRLAAFDMKGFLDTTNGGRWPGHGEIGIVVSSGVVPSQPPAAPTIRAMVLQPLRYEEQHITVRGQFRGRNLYGDLPRAPGLARWEFVLKAGDAAIWVVGVRPRGKGWDLDVDSKLDTNQWLEATGIARETQGIVWVEATEVARSEPGRETEPEPALPAAPPHFPPPDVVFSLPTQDDTDVPPATTVQIQVSRGLDPESIKGRVRASYVGQAEAPGAPAPAIDAEVTYKVPDRVIVVRFPKPLERFRTVKVELQEGIKSVEGQPLKPWTLTFSVGG